MSFKVTQDSSGSLPPFRPIVLSIGTNNNNLWEANNGEDYDQKCKSLLNDKKTYKPLGYNPTTGFRKKVCAFTSAIYAKGIVKIDLKRK